MVRKTVALAAMLVTAVIFSPGIAHASTDYGPAAWVPASSSNYTVSSRESSYNINYVVIHTTQGSYNGTISWFQNPAAQVSAHYVVKSSNGAVTQMVREKDVARFTASANWGTPSPWPVVTTTRSPSADGRAAPASSSPTRSDSPAFDFARLILRPLSFQAAGAEVGVPQGDLPSWLHDGKFHRWQMPRGRPGAPIKRRVAVLAY